MDTPQKQGGNTGKVEQGQRDARRSYSSIHARLIGPALDAD